MGTEAVPTTLQCGSQLDVVVDLPVENDPNLAILVPHRLLAARDIKDSEPAVTEKHMLSLVNVMAFAIRTAVGERGGHSGEICDGPGACEAADAAHFLTSSAEVDHFAHAIRGPTLRFKICSNCDLSQ